MKKKQNTAIKDVFLGKNMHSINRKKLNSNIFLVLFGKAPRKSNILKKKTFSCNSLIDFDKDKK